MSRSINGDNGNTGGVAMTVMDQTQNTDYVFDGELVLYEQQFAEPVTVKVDINLLYSWINCTRASRFYLHIGSAVFVCGVGDSVTHTNQIEKIVIVAGDDFKKVFKHSAQSLNATKLCCKHNEVSKQIQIVEEKSTHIFGAAKAVGKNGRLRRGSGNSGKP